VKTFCPIIYAFGYSSMLRMESLECLQEKCEWWNPEYERCCLAIMPDKLDELAETLADLFGENGTTCLKTIRTRTIPL
jgi:hypothetical protein